jgi:hypothetical protein
MTDPRSAPPGTALTRAALDRVLARAAQLQGATGEGDDAGTMTEAQIIELGKEVGLSSDAIRQAIAEERSRTLAPEESGALAAVMGASSVTAARAISGSAASVLGALDAFMQRSEGLQVKRRFADQLVWEARRDFFSVFRRTLTISGSGFELAEADSVSAIVAPVSDAKSHARIVADYSVARRRKVTSTFLAAAVLFAIIWVPLTAIGVPVLLVGISASVAVGTLAAAAHFRFRQLIERAHVTLEQALDRLEFADTKQPTTAQVLLDALIGPARPPK